MLCTSACPLRYHLCIDTCALYKCVHTCTWIEPERKWHGGFNVNRGKKGQLNAGVPGRVLYYYDTKQKKK